MHKKNLTADVPAKQLSEKLMNDRYALVFDGTVRYYSTELGLFQITSGNCFGFYVWRLEQSAMIKIKLFYQLFKVG